MSQPDHDAIVNEIRSAQITASPELRERVRGLAAAAPPAAPPRQKRELPWRRWTLVLVPAAIAVALAASLAIGLAGSGKKEHLAASGGAVEAQRAQAPPSLPFTGSAQDSTTNTGAPLRAKAAGRAGSIPATQGRAQLYESELTLKVKDLSSATKRALLLTRDFHGYVRSVDYGSGSERGQAYMTLRVPVGSVQAAIVEFSALGEIIDQHVSIQDVQPTVDKRFRQMQAIRDSIAKTQAQLESPTLTAEQRTALENELVAQRRQLVVLQKQQAALQRLTSYATVELALRAADKAVVVPHEPNRIERALDRAGSILLDEVKVVLYVLIVGAPLLALAVLAFGGVRLRRRRDEARLLASA
ncbi:MAG TPA: DUF4349 domain-containing protein [Gaiellaceae bacterium]|nr:DUF4349 domain-containing protein [Gaiellaceae bacterium]